jgi:hypothetical protein
MSINSDRPKERKGRRLDDSNEWETEQTRQMNAEQLYKHREDVLAGKAKFFSFNNLRFS